MPIFSYLAVPKEGQKQTLLDDLSSISQCQVFPADNEDLIILITDSINPEAEQRLQENIRQLTSLQTLSMTFGHTG